MMDMNQPTPDDTEDIRNAEAEVQQILTESQTQALYRALVASRVEVARLQAQLAETPTASPETG